jgi:cytochrome c-type biogenesis protein CcmE
MNPKRKKRLMLVLVLVSGVGIAVALATVAFQQNMLYFFSPTQVMAGEAPQGRSIRVGGMVATGTFVRETDSLKAHFDVTDYKHTIKVEYEGILPDLFREGQGVVAIGEMGQDNNFIAKEVLAKHDENYMPPEVADALKAAQNDATEMPPTTMQQ